MRMSILHGGRAAALMLATGAAADHSLQSAVIVGSFGLAGIIIGPFITDWVRARRHAHDINHDQAHRDEMLAIVEHYYGELEEKDAMIADLEAQLARRRRR